MMLSHIREQAIAPERRSGGNHAAGHRPAGEPLPASPADRRPRPGLVAVRAGTLTASMLEEGWPQSQPTNPDTNN